MGTTRIIKNHTIERENEYTYRILWKVKLSSRLWPCVKKIKKINSNAIINGNTSPPRNGAFEVTIDGKLVYSKFQTGNFPKSEDISSWFK